MKTAWQPAPPPSRALGLKAEEEVAVAVVVGVAVGRPISSSPAFQRGVRSRSEWPARLVIWMRVLSCGKRVL